MEEKKYLVKCKLFVKVGEGVAEAKKYVRAEPSMRLPLWPVSCRSLCWIDDRLV